MSDPLVPLWAAKARLFSHGKTPNPQELAELERAIATEKIAREITKSCAASPPLHAAQRERLIDLLLGR